LRAQTCSDAAGEVVGLKYVKDIGCSTDCTWYEDKLTKSVHGQITAHERDGLTSRYAYDGASRLIKAEDHESGSCARRTYNYDANSNRTTRTVTAGAVCSGSGGATTSYSYDGADRLSGTGVSYDSFGRTTRLPEDRAGGADTSFGYYANDQLRKIAWGTTEKTYLLDPAGRQRAALRADGDETTQMHYADSSDSPAWTATEGSSGQELSYTRDITGITGDLVAQRNDRARSRCS